MPNNSSVALDLDALSPKSVEINYKNKTITVDPPTLEQYAELLTLSAEMSAIQGNQDPTTIALAYEKIKLFLYKTVPELNQEPLNIMQITAVFTLLGELSAPQGDKATEELKKRGIDIKADNTGPKVLTSPELSPSS